MATHKGGSHPRQGAAAPEKHPDPPAGPRTEPGAYPAIRWALASVAILLAVSSLIFALFYKAFDIDQRTTYQAVIANDAVKSAIDLKAHESASFFELSLLIAGALLGLMLAKPDEVRLTLEDKQELAMFVSACLLLVSSMLAHSLYSSAVTEVCLNARTDRQVSALEPAQELNPDWKIEAMLPNPSDPARSYAIESKLSMEDPRDPAIEYLLQGQLLFLLLGAAAAGMTLISARYLKGVRER